MRKEKSCGIIVVKDNKVLMVKQKSDICTFPKGHVEENETEMETAIREVKEETNIDAKIKSDKRYVVNYIIDDFIDKTVVFFIGEPINTDVVKQDSEIKEVMWVNIDDVNDTLSYDNIRKLWKKVLGDIK